MLTHLVLPALRSASNCCFFSLHSSAACLLAALLALPTLTGGAGLSMSIGSSAGALAIKSSSRFTSTLAGPLSFVFSGKSPSARSLDKAAALATSTCLACARKMGLIVVQVCFESPSNHIIALTSKAPKKPSDLMALRMASNCLFLCFICIATLSMTFRFRKARSVGTLAANRLACLVDAHPDNPIGAHCPLLIFYAKFVFIQTGDVWVQLLDEAKLTQPLLRPRHISFRLL